ncbi:MAG: S1 family peptidase [Candidatus Saccharibacteria bacterium]
MRGRITFTAIVVATLVPCLVAALFTARIMTMDRDARLLKLELEHSKKETGRLRANNQQLIDTLKLQAKSCGSELGVFSKTLIKKYSRSFVPVYALYKEGRTTKGNYGTAGYLGDGYFLTSKHVVVLLPHADSPKKPLPKVYAIKLSVNGQLLDAELVDSGDSEMRGEVNLGDWAIIKAANPVPDSLQPIKRLSPGYRVSPGEPLLRYGNDYDRGIVASTGLAGTPSDGGSFGWLADGHPGYSGGGVLNLKEELIGLNGGTLDGDNRMSVAIPLCQAMLRRLPETLKIRLTRMDPKTAEAADVASNDLLP